MATLTIADLDNGKRDLETVDAVANSQADTTTTRYGQQIPTLAAVLRRLGWRAPVPYAPGLNVDSPVFTVEYGTAPNVVVYRPDPALVPFTTAAWNPAQWRVVQNTDDSNLVYQFESEADAQAAAATLPEGSSVIVDGETQGHATAGAYSPDSGTPAVRLQDYSAIDAYSGKAQAVDIVAPGIAGRFYRRGTAASNGITVIKDALGRSWEREHNGVINVEWAGAKGDGATDSTTAIHAARNFIANELAAGNRVKLVFPPGRYLYSSSPNWAINRLDLEFQGEVWLINTGTDTSFLMDGGATGAGVLGIKIKGYPLVYGGASTTHGYYVRSVHRSDLELNCRGAGSAYSGMYMAWCVSNTVKYIMNFNEGGLYNTPSRGLTLTSRAANEETSYNTFINAECSGMPVGVYEDGSLGNVFIGGAVQACTNVGLQQTANTWNSKFIGTDFEVNTNGDIETAGRECQFIGVDLEKKITFKSGSVNSSMIGGVASNISVDAGATRVLISGTTYNRFGGGSIVDSGTSTRFRDIRDKLAGTVSNAPRGKAYVTVGASPFTYTNATGNDIDLLIDGGVVTQLVYTRFAGDALSIKAGQFLLSPGDSMTVKYTTAPTVISYSR